jgi:protein-tyrosine sulfotransferase
MKKIFIGGAPRSGTTYLGAMLQALPGAIVTPESQFKTEIVFISAADFSKKLVLHRKFKPWKIDFSELIEIEAQNIAAFMDALVHLYGKKNGCSKAILWIDHTPGNLRSIVAIKTFFPDSKFIHIHRDGRGIAASTIPLEWGGNTIPEVAKHWLVEMGYGLSAELFFQDDVYRIQYEDLIVDPNIIIRRGSKKIEELGTDVDYLNTRHDVSFIPDYSKNQHKLVGGAPDPKRLRILSLSPVIC